MLITGARGMAKEVYEVLKQSGYPGKIFFFDDVNRDIPDEIYGCPVLKSMAAAAELFRQDNNYVLGLGNPASRRIITEKFTNINGRLNSVISPLAAVGKFGNIINTGCTIMTGVVITNDVTVGTGALINVNASVSHDSIIGDFAEISPAAVITGNCSIGNFALIGANATVLPGVKIGQYATVGAGAVVTKDVADNTVVMGVPAKQFDRIS